MPTFGEWWSQHITSPTSTSGCSSKTNWKIPVLREYHISFVHTMILNLQIIFSTLVDSTILTWQVMNGKSIHVLIILEILSNFSRTGERRFNGYEINFPNHPPNKSLHQFVFPTKQYNAPFSFAFHSTKL